MPRPVPVVRIVVPDDEGKVLILKRAASTHGLGQWCLPGGKVDYGETVQDAVAAELWEETGLTCTSARFLFHQDSLPPEPGAMHCINLYFECTTSGTVRLDEESSDFAWIGPGDLHQYDIAFRNDAGLVRYWGENR